MSETMLNLILGGMLTIAGALIGITYERAWRAAGRIRFKCSAIDFRWIRTDSCGQGETTDRAHAKSAWLKGNIEIYNSSDLDTALQDIEILVAHKRLFRKAVGFSYIPASTKNHKEIRWLNLPSREIVEIQFQDDVEVSEALMFDRPHGIYLCYRKAAGFLPCNIERRFYLGKVTPNANQPQP